MTNAITSSGSGTLRSDFTGWVGCQFVVGAADIYVSSLGRWKIAGNSSTITVIITENYTGTPTIMASVSIDMSSGSAGAYQYVSLVSQVKLETGGTFQIWSLETGGGDQWYDDNDTTTSTADITLSSSCYQFGAGSPPSPSFHLGAGHVYVQPNFQYSLSPLPPPLPAASQNAKRDENHVPTMIATNKNDGITIDLIKVNPVGHGLQISNGTGGTDHGTPNAQRDQNHVPCLMGISSADGITPVAIYTDGNGKLLTQST